MKITRLKLIVVAGTLAFVGIVGIQIYLLRQAFDYEERKISQSIQVSLLEVANEINAYYGYHTPSVNPVEKLAKDYYIVNMRNDFDAKVLELILTNKFKSKGITSNYEYAIYDCETDHMLYGSYVSVNPSDSAVKSTASYFPKANHLVYYFAVRLPQVNSFIYKSLDTWLLLSVVMLIALCIYLYAIYIILQQQKFASLQKDFINNMTHEFKTPLASILIASKFLSQQQSIIADSKLQQYSTIILDQGKKLDSHLEKILNVARNDNNPEALQITDVDIVNAVNNAAAVIRLKYPEAVININAAAAQILIKADEFHFTNIVYNFLDNAIKYCDRQPVIDVSISEEKDAVRMQVSDNGIGISSKHLKHVFEKFYRVPANNSKAVNGFGLGLYYVQKICSLHGWKIKLNSETGKGTTFNLLIKRHDEAQNIIC